MPSIGKRVPKTFANELLQHWGIGRHAVDDGVLILHAVDLRRFEIEVGYGLEGALTDVQCARMLSEIAVPHMQTSQVDRAHVELVAELVGVVLRVTRMTKAEGVYGIHGAGPRRADIALSQREVLAGAILLCLVVVLGVWLVYKRKKLLSQPRQAYQVFASFWAKLWVVAVGLAGAFVPYGLVWSDLWWDGLGICALVCACAALAVLSYTAGQHAPPPERQPKAYRTALLVLVGIVILLSIFGLSRRTEAGWLLLGRVNLAFACLCLAWAFLLTQLRKTRLQPRVCSECEATMRRLNDFEEEAHLSAGEVAEQDLGARDYDAWQCPQGHTQIEEYGGHISSERCPECAHATYRCTETVILEAPTRVSPGVAEDHFRCFHCEHRDTIQRRLPPRGSSSGGGSSLGGGGGGGGGSFGGGRSGGGGAGAKY